MRLTIDGMPATIHIPDDHHIADAVIVARVIRTGHPRQDFVSVGSTDHTGSMVEDMLLTIGQCASLMEDVDEDANDD